MVVSVIKAKEKVQKSPQIERFYGTGKRKTSIARVWINRGSGKIVVNKKDVSSYFTIQKLRHNIGQPFKMLELVDHYDVVCTIKGGGLSGQADALKHGISRALATVNEEWRKVLRKGGLLTRDSREVEAKKYGRHKARKGYRFVKR